MRRSSTFLVLGEVYVVKLSSRGQHGARRMRALNASTRRRWPKGAENDGAWFAGDPAFGGVMVVPGTNNMLFLQPAGWEKYARERAEADPQRQARAEQAGISRLLEKEPNVMIGLGN
ncbi:hypothetical protein ACFQVC_24520 [Streptomyces monticola]|uniref:DUF1330 domain-containing protein n=1 Tax=Streptomyces monticola TaxID=2666263 RepID=A0ABW2JNB9_9ACTN